MDKFLIKGPCKVKGTVNISGSKNASLPILAASILFDEMVEIKNLPNVRDIDTMLSLIKSLGFNVKQNKNSNSVVIKKSKKINTFASYSLVKTMRAGILVLGPLITKFGKAKTSLPGGCLIGARPINYHLNALKKLGMNYKIEKGYVNAFAKSKLTGSNIFFPKISVGATENAILAATLANGKTILKNCAIEPEIKNDLTNFLNQAGEKIKWIGKRTVEIKGFDPKLINTELNLLKKVGAKIKINEKLISIVGPEKIKPIKNIVTKEWPGVATDMQSQLMVLMCRANGKSTITENIFENRFLHVGELQRLGADIQVKKNKAIIRGNTKFVGAEVMSSDLRASVALVLAAIISNGKSTINRIYHLDRGYEKIEKKLTKIGVNIKRIS